MNEIKCPKCGEIFEIDESKYMEIVAQVRNDQFEKDLAERLAADRQLMESRQEKLVAEASAKHQQDMAKKDQEITRLSEQVKGLEAAQKQELELLRAKEESLRREAAAEMERQIQDLQSKVKAAEMTKELAVTKAVQEQEKKISDLNAQIFHVERVAKDRERLLNERIAMYKDMKIRLSTKMLGETLEQHCMTVFRQHQDEFPDALFEKDNEAVEGTKGDFVYRESTPEGIEVLSIMFEMKNEADDTVRKHRNEEFLPKLDKDRQKKGCEYAVLVTMLEPEDEVYNEGIVAARQFDKMFIVRPQFFLTMIRVLRKAALASLEARRELMLIQRENLDVQKFEATLTECRDQFGKKVSYAQDHFEKAIKEINATIKHLENIRDELEMTGKQLGQANGKLQELTIKKLTKGNIGMQQKFLEAGIPIE